MFSSCFAHNSVQKAPTGPKVGLAYRENIPLQAFSGLDFFIWDHISCSRLVLPITLSRKLPQAPKLAWLILAYRENIPLEAFSGLDFLIWDHISCSHLVLFFSLVIC